MQISNEVIKILEYLGEKIGVTIDWTSNNVLPYVEELCKKFIEWEANTSIAWIIIAGIVIIFSLALAILISCLSDWDGFEWAVFGLIAFAMVVVIGVQVFDIIECKYFPEKAIALLS